MKQMGLCIILSLSMGYGLVDCASRISPHTKNQLFKQGQVVEHKHHKKGEPLRILFVVESFPHFDQPFILDQIVGVLNRGHDVYIAAKYEVKSALISNVVRQYKLIERTLFFGKSNPLELLHYHARIPHINTFDVICCQFGNVGADIVRFKRGLHGMSAKLATCWRGAIKEVSMQPYAHAALFEQGDLFLPVCDFLKTDLMRLGCDESKTHVLCSGIDYDCYPCKRGAHKKDIVRLMSACRLVEKKGIEYAIRAVASAVKVYPNIYYTIVGDGPLKQHLKSVVKELGMHGHIKLIGNQPHEKIPELLCNTDIFLSPSITTADGNHEGIANALKEAMASGALVIGTEHAGTAELVKDGVSGFLVPERDIDALAEKICYLITHSEIWNGVGVSAQQTVRERFCLSDSIDKFIAIIEEVCIG